MENSAVVEMLQSSLKPFYPEFNASFEEVLAAQYQGETFVVEVEGEEVEVESGDFVVIVDDTIYNVHPGGQFHELYYPAA